MNLYRIHFIRITQAEVNAGVIVGDKAAAAEHVSPLLDASGGEVHRGADRISGTFWSPGQAQFHPMMVIGVHVAQECGHGVEVVDDGVDAAVVEEIAESGAACRDDQR